MTLLASLRSTAFGPMVRSRWQVPASPARLRLRCNTVAALNRDLRRAAASEALSLVPGAL